jgi:hypothetical protein
MPPASMVRSASRASVPGLARATTRPFLIATSRDSVVSGETTSPPVMSRSSISRPPLARAPERALAASDTLRPDALVVRARRSAPAGYPR